MENNSTAYHAPDNFSITGWILLTVGVFTGLIALAENTRTGFMAGAILTVIGALCIMIGKYRKKHKAERKDTVKED